MEIIITSDGTTHHTFSKLILGYLFLSFSMGIHNIQFEELDSKGHGLGWLRVSSDGMLMFKALTNKDWDRLDSLFQVVYFNNVEYKLPQPPKTLEEIKKMFIADLQPKKKKK